MKVKIGSKYRETLACLVDRYKQGLYKEISVSEESLPLARYYCLQEIDKRGIAIEHEGRVYFLHENFVNETG